MALSGTLREALATARSNKAHLPHNNEGPKLNIIVWCLTGLAAIFLALRLYCKRLRHNKLWWDDYILIAAFVALVTQTSLLSVYVHFGLGRHSWDIHNWNDYLYVGNITGVCSIIAASWSKTSFAVTLLRLSTDWMRRLVWFIIVTVNLFLGLSCIFTYVQCTPVRKVWASHTPGTCWPKEVIITYNSFSSSWSGAMDIVLAILPWLLINRLTLNKKERIGVIIGMSIGSLAGVTSIAKTATLSAIKNPDTISSVNLMILATSETAITIVAACIPVLRVFIKNTIKSNSQSSRPDSQMLSRKFSGFELLAPPSPARTPSYKKMEIAPWLDEETRIPARTSCQKLEIPPWLNEENYETTSIPAKTWASPTKSKSTEDSWLSSASVSVSHLEVSKI